MKFGIIGAGSVGQTLAAALAARGHDVVIGIRRVDEAELSKPRNQALPVAEWLKAVKGRIRVATFAETAAHGDMLFNATSGAASVDALTLAGAANLAGKVLVDVANPLDFSRGMPPSLLAHLSNGWSLGEDIQKRFPDARVVKAFNTVAAPVMVDAGLVPAPHDLFISGNDEAAKAAVGALARDAFGWMHIVDLGDIVGARAQEALLHLWVRQWMRTGKSAFNIHIAS